jgi:hypothetical protein
MKVMALKAFSTRAVEDEEMGMETETDAEPNERESGGHERKLSDGEITLTPSSSKPDWPLAQQVDSDDELVTW